MARTRARGPRGQRVVCKTPHGHWKVLSTIAALTTCGILGFGSFDGATDTETVQTPFLSPIPALGFQASLVEVLLAGNVPACC